LALPLSDGSSGVGSAQNRQKSVDNMDPSTIAEAKAMQLRQQAGFQQAPRFEKRANSINQAPVRRKSITVPSLFVKMHFAKTAMQYDRYAA